MSHDHPARRGRGIDKVAAPPICTAMVLHCSVIESKPSASLVEVTKNVIRIIVMMEYVVDRLMSLFDLLFIHTFSLELGLSDVSSGFKRN